MTDDDNQKIEDQETETAHNQEAQDQESHGQDDLLKAIKDLESQSSGILKSSAKPNPMGSAVNRESAVKVPRTTENAEIIRKQMSKYDELRKKPSMKAMGRDDLMVMEELSDVVAPVNKAVTLLERFQHRYPNEISEEKLNMWRNGLKETASIMLSEFYSLRHGKKQKVYSEDKICKVCHAVFMCKLPDGICDECKSRQR